ncbi:hypothetical protein PYCC9005_005609 [Savitreella phatthalungensis]
MPVIESDPWSYDPSLHKRDSLGNGNSYVDIPTWKIIVFSMIPLAFIIAGLVYFLGVRRYRAIQRREAAEDRFDALDYDDDEPLDAPAKPRAYHGTSYLGPYMHGAGTSPHDSSSTIGKDAGRPLKSSGAVYQLGEWKGSMTDVPVVKDGDTRFIQAPPADDDHLIRSALEAEGTVHKGQYNSRQPHNPTGQAPPAYRVSAVPSDSQRKEWGFEDPKIAEPRRAHSPTNPTRLSRQLS